MFNKPKVALMSALVLTGMVAGRVEAIVAKVSNPPSLLSTKKVLVIHGNTSGDHLNARNALTVKFKQIQALYGFQMDSAYGTTGGNPGSGALDQYDIIVFNYWFDTQLSSATFQSNFKAWVNSTNKRRGWIGMHTSGANTDGEWNWLRDSVTSMRYNIHSTPVQPGVIRKTTDPTVLAHPIMQAMADTFRVPSDEWYDWETTAPTYGDIRVMYNLDETTLANAPSHPMNPHPMAWYRENPVTKNRFFYTPLVHSSPGVTSVAGNDFFASLMMRALEYVAGYDTTSTAISMNGDKLSNFNPHPYVFVRNELKISATGAFKVEIVSLQGRTLFRASGKNNGSYRPALLRKPGVYLVKISAKGGAYSQRIMVQ